MEQAEELSVYKIQRCRLQVGFPSNSFEVHLLADGAASCSGFWSAWVGLSVCLRLGGPALCGEVWLSRAPVPGWAGCVGEGKWGVRGVQLAAWVWTGVCAGMLGTAAKRCFLVLFEISIPFLLNYRFVAHVIGQVIFHHILP